MTIKNNFKTLLIPIYLLVLIMGQSCVSVQRMRYTNGLNINLSAYGKEKNTNIEYKHASKAKKKVNQPKVSHFDTNPMVAGNYSQTLTCITENTKQDLIANVNLTAQATPKGFSTVFKSELKPDLNFKQVKASPSSLQKTTHKTDEIITSNGNLSRGQIMLLALLTNMLAAIAILLLTSAATSTNVVGVLFAGLCAVVGVLVAKYGFEEAQYDTGWFNLLYYFACFPGFTVNACIAVAFLFVISFA
jgi:hypothetical protein